MRQLDDLTSPEYRDQLKGLHASTTWGDEGDHWVHPVRRFVDALNAKSILDYGCGRGMLAKALGGNVPVAEYDPAIEGKDAMPFPADLVVATDVLEHIEPDRLQVVLGHIYSLASRGVFLIIACAPARHKLPDGRNAHLIIQTPKWWLRQLREYDWREIQASDQHKSVAVWLTKRY